MRVRIIRSGDGEKYGVEPWLFKQGSLTEGRFDFMVGDIAYLSGPPLHIHRDQDDSFFVLKGILTVQVGDELHELGPGDFATVPPGVAHTFDNIHKDQQPVTVCNLVTPGGLDALFRDMHAAGAFTETMRERHGLTVAGPTIGAKLGLS